MAGKRNKHLSYGIEMELDFLCGKINVNEHIRRTYIDRETLAKCSGRSLIETVEFIEYGNKSLIEHLDMIIAEVRRSISEWTTGIQTPNGKDVVLKTLFIS